MTQTTFEDFARRVSYSVVRLTHPGETETPYMKSSIRQPHGGLLVNVRPLLIADVLPEQQKADYLIMKARQCERRLWEAVQNRLPEQAE